KARFTEGGRRCGCRVCVDRLSGDQPVHTRDASWSAAGWEGGRASLRDYRERCISGDWGSSSLGLSEVGNWVPQPNQFGECYFTGAVSPRRRSTSSKACLG